jgi:Glycosyltransferase family 87
MALFPRLVRPRGGRTITTISLRAPALADRYAHWRERAGRRDLATGAFVVVVGALVAFRLLNVYPWNAPVFDLRTYWATRFGIDFSTQHAGPAGAYLYSPAFAQLIAPLTLLPLPIFAAIWTAIGAGLLYWMAGRHAIVFLLLPAVLITFVQGQLDLLFAAGVIIGMRYPAVWAVPLLTKVTPGVGLVWFLVRREWRSLGMALTATVAVVAISARFDPQAWVGWFALLGRSEFPDIKDGLLFIPIALWVRLPLALAIVAWGAATDRRWTIPVAVTLGMPIVWLNSPTILVGILPLVAAGAATPAGRWLRREPASAEESLAPGRADPESGRRAGRDAQALPNL